MTRIRVALFSCAAVVASLFAPVGTANALDYNECSLSYIEYGYWPDAVNSARAFVQNNIGFPNSESSNCSETFDHYEGTVLSTIANQGTMRFLISGDAVPNGDVCAVDVSVNGEPWISGTTHFEAGLPNAQLWESSTTQSDKTKFNEITHIGKNIFSANISCPGHPTATRVQTGYLNIIQPSFNDSMGVSIDDGAEFSDTRAVKVNLSFDEIIGLVRISNDGGFGGSQTQDFTYVKNTVNWKLNASRDQRMVKTIYVKYRPLTNSGTLGPWSHVITDDIILDTTSPVIKSASATSSRPTLSTLEPIRSLTANKTLKLKLKAKDNRSGVSRVQISVKANKSNPISKAFKKTLQIKGLKVGSKVYLRVRDGAGNWSKWKTVKVK